MGKIHPLNMQGYHNTGCFNCAYRDLILALTCQNNYSNVYYRATIYCKKKKQVVAYPHERCNLKTERTPIKPLGEYSHV